MDPTEQLTLIIPTLTHVVDNISDDQLGDSTPCAQFDVAGLIDHVLTAASFVPKFRGDGPAVDTSPTVSAAGGRVPAAEMRAVLADLLDAVRSPGAMERTVEAPIGNVPGEVMARFAAFDLLIHGWDLASATGQSFDPRGDVVAEVDVFARSALAPEMRNGDTFAHETSAPAEATPLESLVAFSGRTV
jgi:uncharacterized protein (TIGR03086 family)